jgi:hypothetical protein
MTHIRPDMRILKMMKRKVHCQNCQEKVVGSFLDILNSMFMKYSKFEGMWTFLVLKLQKITRLKERYLISKLLWLDLG